MCIGQGANISFKDFETFCPKAIAGIGQLPDTVADRSIPIRLKRKGPNEAVERFRRRNVLGQANEIRERIPAWGVGTPEKPWPPPDRSCQTPSMTGSRTAWNTTRHSR